MAAWGRRTPSAQTPAWSRQNDYHKEFAGKLKEQIEQGVVPWQKPWKPGEERLPKNIQTGKPYRGGNSVYLSVTQTAKGYSDHRWATYKQIKDMGGQVRKGEKATHVLFCKFDDEKEKPQPGARVALGVLQSANLWGRPVTVFACTFAPCAQAEDTIGAFFRKLARPAGFEPATLGLEGPVSDRLYQDGYIVLSADCPHPPIS